MTYENMVPGIFRDRPNRFIAHVEIGGAVETVHVKNTGRCRELLVPGAKVWCQHFAGTPRKTQYDLICVEKENYLINMDSQAPNKAVQEWLLSGGLGEIQDLRPETLHGDSRFDFAFRKGDKQCYLEVKGVTLENGGICAFPDAPTERGAKHLRGLQRAVTEGCVCYALFVIQMRPVLYLHPNDATDPAFGKALREAAAGGVHVLAVDCQVTPNSMTVGQTVEVRL